VRELEKALRSIIHNDKTVYAYDGKDALDRDGEKSKEGRWATPRELAQDILTPPSERPHETLS